MDRASHGFVAVVAIGTLLSCVFPAVAQGPPAHELKRQAELVQKYDRDGDGKLSPTELRAARPSGPPRGVPGAPSAHRDRKPGTRLNTPGNELTHDAEIQAILERFDANGNGTLDLKEMDALRKARKREAAVPRDERRQLQGFEQRSGPSTTRREEQHAP